MTIPPIPADLLPGTPEPEPVAPPVEPAPLTVAAEPESRLEQLHALYPVLKAQAEDAAQKFKAVTDAIKLELTALSPEEKRFELTSSAEAPPLRLTWSVSRRIDSARLKREQPGIFEAYVKPSGSWTLKAGS